MKLEDITALGIPEEQAKKLLTQHEAELTAEQQKTTDLTEELNTAKKSVADLTDQVKKFDGEDIEGLKKAAADWETKYNDDIAALKLDKALELELVGAKARDVGIVKSQLNLSTMKLGEDGKLTGFKEQLEKLQADKGFLFEGEEKQDAEQPVARVNSGLPHGTGSKTEPATLTDALREHYEDN